MLYGSMKFPFLAQKTHLGMEFSPLASYCASRRCRFSAGSVSRSASDISTPYLACLGFSHTPPDDIAPDGEELTQEVNVSPLQADQLTSSHSSVNSTKEDRGLQRQRAASASEALCDPSSPCGGVRTVRLLSLSGRRSLPGARTSPDPRNWSDPP
jgi:hypothetical protein